MIGKIEKRNPREKYEPNFFATDTSLLRTHFNVQCFYPWSVTWAGWKFLHPNRNYCLAASRYSDTAPG